jgi:hypothetical protein
MAITLYCWRCGVEKPMLNPEEAAVVHAALRSAIEETQRYREQYGTSLESALASGAGAYGTQQALALYEQITGYSESDAEVLWHHDISKFGPACRTCGKPLRTASAKICVECGAARAAV